MVDMAIVLLSTVFLAVIYAWHRAYPRPYEDVPYSTQSERRLLGDIPDIVQFVKDGNAPEDLIADRCRRLNSPIIQLFFEPFSRPLIFLDDTAAVSNIVCTRSKEPNRAPITVRTLLFFTSFPGPVFSSKPLQSGRLNGWYGMIAWAGLSPSHRCAQDVKSSPAADGAVPAEGQHRKRQAILGGHRL